MGKPSVKNLAQGTCVTFSSMLGTNWRRGEKAVVESSDARGVHIIKYPDGQRLPVEFHELKQVEQ